MGEHHKLYLMLFLPLNRCCTSSSCAQNGYSKPTMNIREMHCHQSLVTDTHTHGKVLRKRLFSISNFLKMREFHLTVEINL